MTILVHDKDDNVTNWKKFTKIPEEVRKMLFEQGIIFVSTCTKANEPNVSPRTAFWILDNNVIAICDWHMRKTFWNWQDNNRMAAVVTDLSNFTGWQLKGHCEIITDKQIITDTVRKVMTSPPHAEFNRTMQHHAGRVPPMLVKFIVDEIFSSNPD